MKQLAAVCVLAGSLAVAGPASAHDRDGAILGALIGGAVLGALVTSALSQQSAVAYPPPVAEAPDYPPAAYQAPAYQAPDYQAPAYPLPVYDAPAYQQARYRDGDGYGAPPAGYCYDRYRRAYVGCAMPMPDGYRDAPPQPAGW